MSSLQWDCGRLGRWALRWNCWIWHGMMGGWRGLPEDSLRSPHREEQSYLLQQTGSVLLFFFYM